ncbi:hypothetical protein C7437_1011046 [Psychrobacillus insolitus]|uniref:Uncharacterized protein n=1 Tax=Psychrobacillus insolitus TaxID=1461 RepID=A0A2W7MRW9_9BACI|nr:hypothetical protein [Psychrobacillus insolitus]PZX07924.1 hypothetical protein C7437_1011046 [Psychrobacillus insolitus]
MARVITTLFKRGLVICGHLNKGEITSLKEEGWVCEKRPNINKHGISVKEK